MRNYVWNRNNLSQLDSVNPIKEIIVGLAVRKQKETRTTYYCSFICTV